MNDFTDLKCVNFIGQFPAQFIVSFLIEVEIVKVYNMAHVKKTNF